MDYRENTHIDASARIAKSAVILGDVRIGKNVTVLWNATLRGDFGGHIEVGDGSNVQEAVCLHVREGGSTIVGQNVTIGHGAIVHGCTIGDGTLVGMGATVIDRAKVGKHCLIGAGALVTGTANIPDGMLVVGSPAKALRPLTDAELASLDAAARDYDTLGVELLEQGFLVPGDRYDPLAP